MTADEPTQLDRIEAKLDQLLSPTLRFTSNFDPDAVRREFTEADRKRHQRLFLLPESPQDKPHSRGWKTAAVTVALILVVAAVGAASWWLWGVFIRAHL